jgi:RNA polymerase sigma-70 factor, ECF subfamily
MLYQLSYASVPTLIVMMSGDYAQVRGWRRESSLSRFLREWRYMVVNAPSEAVQAMEAHEAPFDFDSVFRAHYERVARVIARVIGEPARAEELAAELFLRLWQCPRAQGQWSEGWLYKTAVRRALDELRKRTRRARYERLVGFERKAPNPEEARSVAEDQQRVRTVLGSIQPREAELLVLRSQDFSYDELAAALNLNPVSVGTLLTRAQKAFRKEYVRRYGEA